MRRAIVMPLALVAALAAAAGEDRTELERRAADAYFADDFRRSARLYDKLRRAEPDNPLWGYRAWFSKNELAQPSPKLQRALERVIEQFRRAWAEGRDPLAAYYLILLTEHEDPQRARVIRDRVVAHWHEESYDALGVFQWMRLAQLAWHEDASPVDQSRYLWNAIRAEDGRWYTKPFATEIVDLVCLIGEEFGRLSGFTREIEPGLEAADDDPALRLARIRLEVECGERTDFELPSDVELAALRPRDLDVIGDILLGLDRHEERIAVMRRAVERSPAREFSWGDLAESQIELGRLDDAERSLRAALKADPRYASGWMTLGRVLLARQRPDQALEPLTRATELDPGWEQPRQLLAQALQQLERPADALSVLKRPGIDGAPQARTLELIATSHVQLDQLAEALEVCAVAVLTHPSDARLGLVCEAIARRGPPQRPDEEQEGGR